MLLLSATALAAAIGSAVASGFDWTTIEPTRDLRYHDCYERFRCARLTVPLDWNNPDDNRTVAIAITTLPAKVPIDHPDFGGTIFTNPGGPGGSGVTFINSYGPILQQIVDGNKKYEILSWDPRGVQFTTPRVDCFNDTLARDAWQMERRGLGWSGDGSDEALKRHIALFKARGALCDNTLGDGDILKHVSTAAVCRDMVEMADRNDELRKKQLAQMRRAGGDAAQHALVAAARGPQADDEVVRVQYMGFSYGTVLGNTFASMFPGRVGRVMIDGVVDIGNYMDGLWSRNLMDTEAIVALFYDACFAERERCPLRAAADTSGADIKERIEKLAADLEAAPAPFVQGTTIRFVTGEDIRAAFKGALYNPLGVFPRLAANLAEALKGNYTPIFRYNDQVPALKDACSSGANEILLTPDATGAIACSDVGDSPARPFGFYKDLAAELKNQSRTFGPWWTDIPVQCVGMRAPPGWTFSGPWTTPPADPSIKEGVPAAPLLFLSTRLDPVTPLVNARLMSAGHPGSAVVVQEGAGHCVVATIWSECINQIVRDFFEHGTVPQNGTVCESGCRPWNEGECGPLGERVHALAGSAPEGWFDGRLPLGI